MKHIFLSPWRKLSEEMNPGKLQSQADDTPETLYPFEHDPATKDGGSEFLNDKSDDKSNELTGDQPMEPGHHRLVIISDVRHNITDGCEFLDDAIRTFDQPLIQLNYREENIASRSENELMVNRLHL